MPRFFFNSIEDGHKVRDPGGVELSDLLAVHQEAAAALGSQAKDILQFEVGLEHAIEIRGRDITGQAVFICSFVFEARPLVEAA